MAVDDAGADVAVPEVPHLRVGVAHLRRHAGSREELHRVVEVGERTVASISVAPPGHVELDVVLESLSDGIVVSGTLLVPWRGACRRCLEQTAATAEVELREIFAEAPLDEDLRPLRGDEIDLGPAVLDAALLALPLAPLCSDDCVGPAPDAFPVEPATDAAPGRDPRWAALDELRFDPGPDDR